MKYKRRNYLINPRFQLKFGILSSILLALSSSIYPLSFYNTIGDLVETFSRVSPSLMSDIKENRTTILYFFIKWQLVVSTLIFVICIFFSHKIAGPIYKVRKSLNQMKQEGQWKPIFLRKGDYFPELADDLNQLFAAGGSKSGSNLCNIKEINSSLSDLAANAPQDKKEALNEVIAKLSEVQKRFDA